MESDLSQPVSDWLIAKGFTPYAEVPFPHDGPRQIDLVGRNGVDLITVELKCSLTAGVIHQTCICDLITDRRYAAIASRPKAAGVERCQKVGIGLLSVNAGVVNEILAPQDRHYETGWVRTSYVTEIHKTLDRLQPNGVGGLPCMKGVGPAQECYDRVQIFLASNPQARWREIYQQVPNHYGSALSMCNAMRTVIDTRRAREVNHETTSET